MTVVTIDSGTLEQMQYIMYGLAAAAILGWGMLMLTFTISPASGTLLWIKLKKQDAMLILRENRSLIIRGAKYNNGSANLKGLGDFIFNSDAMFTLPGGIRSALCFDNMTFSPSPGFIKAAHNLIKNGIQNIISAQDKVEDVMLKGIVREVKRRNIKCTLKDLSAAGYPEDIAMRMVSFAAITNEGTNIDANKVEEMQYLIDIYAIKQFFEKDATPTKVGIVVEREKRSLLAKINKLMSQSGIFSSDNVMKAGALMLFAAVAYVIVQSGAGQNAASSMAQAAGNMTGLKIT